MNSTLSETESLNATESVVAVYRSHNEAEAAVRTLATAGIPVTHISIIGRNFETHEDIQGYYRPGDAALAGASEGAWFGGLFGLMLGAFGFFVFPVVGALVVLGPLSGFLAGAVGGAGIGAIVSALVASGIPRDEALRYQERLQAGEFLVVVHGGSGDVARANDVLSTTTTSDLRTHTNTKI